MMFVSVSFHVHHDRPDSFNEVFCCADVGLELSVASSMSAQDHFTCFFEEVEPLIGYL